MGLFSKKPRTYTEESAYSWSNLVGAITTNAGYDFYDSFKGYTGEELANLGAPVLTFVLPGCEEWQVRECFLPSINEKYLPVRAREGWKETNRKESKFIKRFEEVTESLGLILSSNELDGGETFFYGKWESGRGNLFAQSGIFYKDKSGNEVLYWKTDVLTYPSFTEADLEGLLMMSVQFTQPAIFQAALMLAESPLPSSSMFVSLSRKLGYGEKFPEKLLPRPAIDIALSSMYVKAFDDRIEGIESPLVTGLGFEISDKLTNEQLSQALVVVMDAFASVFTMLEDGYINYGPKSKAPYDALTLAPGLGEELNDSRWIPITLA